MDARLLIVGLDPPESDALKNLVGMPVIAHPLTPRFFVERGALHVERRGRAQHFLPVDRVIFHAILEDDFTLLTALALWGGPCLPSARGLMDGRLRMPCLARAVAASRFASMPRSFLPPGESITVDAPHVAKWGNWHCGENKERFTGTFTAKEPTVVEPFIEGEAVRICVVGDRHWQIALAGDDWLKSIHHTGARVLDRADPALVDDTLALGRAFGLEMLGVDYMVARDGTPHLLEVNHVPNVTVFPEIREAFLEYAARWVRASIP